MKHKPTQGNLINDDNQANSLSPLLVNCATLAKMFEVSRATIKRYKDAGRISLDANGLVNPRDAMQSILETANQERIKATFFKSQVDSTNILKTENDALKIKLDGMKTKLIELESALTETTQSLNEWQTDYIQLENTIEIFIEQLTTDELLRNAVNECNRDKLQTAFDNLLELEND